MLENAPILVVLFAVTLLGPGACADEQERPPLLSPTDDAGALLICEQLQKQQPQPGADGTFSSTGGPAACPGQGLYCPTDWVVSWCDAGQPVAHCVDRIWHVVCAEVPEAGDAAGDGPQQEGAVQAGDAAEADAAEGGEAG